MVFSSVTFLFYFLPLTLLLYSLAPNTSWRNGVLLVVSLLFYTWGEGFYLLVMLLSISCNYLCGLLIAWRGRSLSRLALTLGVIANLSLLGFYKYANFLVDNTNTLLALLNLPPLLLPPVHLPIGISFFTFQAMSYIIDVYTGRVAVQRNIMKLSLYIALFPQLIAGPIVRYHDIARELDQRRLDLHGLTAGIERFLFGLAKKVLLANPLAVVADQIFALPPTELSPAVAWLGALCYTLQIYFDFSGYSDMAIGLGRMFGFHFPENFNYPYISRSIREFWRRWHISLSTWLRDYLYIPLGGSRKGEVRTYSNLVIVFLLCGLWHGASWTFVLWGAYHGLFLVIERTGPGRYLERLWGPLRWSATLLIVVFGWVLFRSESLGQAISYIAVMTGFATPGPMVYPLAMLIDAKLAVEFCVAALLALPLYPYLCRMRDHLAPRRGLGLVCYEATTCLAQFSLVVALTYFSVISLAAGAYNPFIYFRF